MIYTTTHKVRYIRYMMTKSKTRFTCTQLLMEMIFADSQVITVWQVKVTETFSAKLFYWEKVI